MKTLIGLNGCGAALAAIVSARALATEPLGPPQTAEEAALKAYMAAHDGSSVTVADDSGLEVHPESYFTGTSLDAPPPSMTASGWEAFRRGPDSSGEPWRQAVHRAAREYTGPRPGLRLTHRGACDQLVDDFDDGDALGWATFGVRAGASDAYVQNGRLVLERAQGGDPSPWQWFGAVWTASDGDFDRYYDGRMQLTFRINETRNTFLAFGRGGFASFIVYYWGGAYYLAIGDGDILFTFYCYAYLPFDLLIGADYRMEVTFVGPDLAMRVWRLGDSEPAEPQLRATSPHWGDPSIKYATLGVEMVGQFTTDARRIEVDDITFCPQDADDPPVIDPNVIPVSGIPVPRLAIIDDLTRQFMAATGTKSIVHSWMKDGKVQFHRAYGWVDEAQSEVLKPDAMMRIASISKPFTAAAIRELVAERRLKMRDKVFDLGQPGGGVLHIEPYPALGDERYKDITVQHLIEHTSGWDRGAYGDMVLCDFHAARTLGTPMPISGADRLRFILSTPLQYNPGEEPNVDGYSSVGYDVLGLIVEQVSGMQFEEYVRQRVLPTIGVESSESEPGRSFPADFNPREPFYGCFAMGPNVFDEFGPWVRLPYGGWNQESWLFQGGRIATNAALMRLASHRYMGGPKAGKELPRRLPRDFFDDSHGDLPGSGTDLVHAWVDGDVIGSCISNHRRADEYYNGELPLHPGAAFFVNYALPGLADWPTRKTGDMNCDGRVNHRDIAPFFLAVNDIDSYAAAYPDCTGFNADTNGDLTVNGNDIEGFFRCLRHGGCE